MENSLEQITINAAPQQSPLAISQGKTHAVLGMHIIFSHITEFGFEWADVIKKISETIHRGYHEAATSDTEAALERALQSGNYMIAQLVKEFGKEWLAKLNVIAISLKDKDIHFSRVGNLHAFLIFRNEITDLAPVTSDNGINKNPLKTFTNIISGNLSANSHIVFCTDSVLDYISLERLKRTIMEYGVGEREPAFQELLRRAPASQPFGLLIISRTSATAYTPKPQEDGISSPSQEYKQVSYSPQETSLLPPPLFPTGSMRPRIIDRVIEKIASLIRKAGVHKQSATHRTGTYPRIRRHLYGTHKKSASHLNVTSIKTVAANLADLFFSLPKITKIIVTIALGITILFMLSLFQTKASHTKTKTTQEFEQTISQIQTLLDQSHAAGLYDKTKSRELLSQAFSAIQQLPEDSEEHQTQKRVLEQTTETELNNLRLLRTVQNPEQFFDLQSEEPTMNPKQIILVNDRLYSYNSATNTIVSININDKSSSQFSAGTAITGYLEQAALNGSNIILYHNNKGFVEFDTTSNHFKQITVALNATDQVDIFRMYQKRLYRLDSRNGAIYRHEKNRDGYGSGARWNPQPIPNAPLTTDMVIDGSIYLVLNNGSIMHLEQGVAKPFQLKNVDPQITNPTNIYTSLQSDTLYILDQGTKRIILTNKKTGELIQQYTSPLWNDARDFVVDEKNHTLYILNGSVIYSLDYTQ